MIYQTADYEFGRSSPILRFTDSPLLSFAGCLEPYTVRRMPYAFFI